jgi:hypothetical protein
MHAASFSRLPGTHAVNEDLSHQPRRDTKEVRAALPVDFLLVYQTYKEFVDESSGLECEFVPFAPEIITGHPAELFVEQRHQLFESILFAATPPLQKRSDVRLGRHISSTPGFRASNLPQRAGFDDDLRARSFQCSKKLAAKY